MSDPDPQELARWFRALADPARVRILAIAQANEGRPSTVTELVRELGLAQPTVSHHLKVLVDAGLLRHERSGTWSLYRPVPERLAQIAAAVTPRH